MITSDCHMHTSFSTDSSTAPEAMVESALEKGLKAICVTDHMDWDYPFSEELGKDAFLFDADAYFQKLTKLREQYAGGLSCASGLSWDCSLTQARSAGRSRKHIPLIL